jgi:hypothetical protein
MQNALISMLRHSMPVTFDGLCERVNFKQRLSLERSMRRALKSLVDERIIIALGGGGPGDPHRYCINPTLLPPGRRVVRLMTHLEPEGFSINADGELIISLHSRYAQVWKKRPEKTKLLEMMRDRS